MNIPAPTASEMLTAAWRKAARAERQAEIVKTAAASQVAVEAWREFNKLAADLASAAERRAA